MLPEMGKKKPPERDRIGSTTPNYSREEVLMNQEMVADWRNFVNSGERFGVGGIFAGGDRYRQDEATMPGFGWHRGKTLAALGFVRII